MIQWYPARNRTRTRLQDLSNARLFGVAPATLKQLETLVEHLVINQVCDDDGVQIRMCAMATAATRFAPSLTRRPY